MRKLTAGLVALVALAFMVLMGVRVGGVPPVSGTWEHGEPEHWTWVRLVEGDGRVVGDLSGTLKEAMTRDSSALPLHVAGSWDNPYLELELGGFYYHMGEAGSVCSIAGEVEGGGDRSLLAEWLGRRRAYRLVAVIRCPEEEPFRIVFERVRV